MEVDVGKLPGWAGSALGACRPGMYVEAENKTQFPLLEEE